MSPQLTSTEMSYKDYLENFYRTHFTPLVSAKYSIPFFRLKWNEGRTYKYLLDTRAALSGAKRHQARCWVILRRLRPESHAGKPGRCPTEQECWCTLVLGLSSGLEALTSRSVTVGCTVGAELFRSSEPDMHRSFRFLRLSLAHQKTPFRGAVMSS